MELDLTSCILSETAKALIAAASQIDPSMVDPSRLIIGENAELASELGNLKDENSRLVTKISDLENERDQIQEAGHEQFNELTCAKQELNSLRKNLERCSAEIKRLNTELSSTSSIIQQKDAEIKYLKSHKVVDPESLYQFVLELLGDSNRSQFTQNKNDPKIIDVVLTVPKKIQGEIQIGRHPNGKFEALGRMIRYWDPKSNNWVNPKH
jgi:cell division protein FtsB